jgi:alkylation response protein AidB-like acyl-CoA dehydrogenase
MTGSSAPTDITPGELRDRLREWLRNESPRLEPFRSGRATSLEDDIAHERELQRLLYDAGWTRFGWPVECGGSGGSAVLRGVVYEELTAAGLIFPEAYQILETLGPMLTRYAPELARLHLGPYLAGDELWCQGFSEPDAGSDLAGLRTRAIDEGDCFRLVGQKVWQSLGHISRWCAALVRTGEPDSRHRGLAMMWIDLELPGITVNPIRAANGRNELSEVFFDDALVPKSSLIGGPSQGWEVAMYLLQFERGMYAWQRQARLHTRLQDAVAQSTRPPAETAAVLGDAYLALFALRMKCRETLLRLAAEENPGPEISVDKVLLSTAEQAVFDAVRQLLWPALEIDDADETVILRNEWFYSRATSIFGGAVEVQRDIIAERLLGLPRSR